MFHESKSRPCRPNKYNLSTSQPICCEKRYSGDSRSRYAWVETDFRLGCEGLEEGAVRLDLLPHSEFLLTFGIHRIGTRTHEKYTLQSHVKVVISAYASQIRTTAGGSHGAVSWQLTLRIRLDTWESRYNHVLCMAEAVITVESQSLELLRPSIDPC